MATLIFLLLCLIHSAWTQQLQGTYMPIRYPQLSKSCLNALNTSVACPLALGPLSQRPRLLDSTGTSALCTSSCLTSLQNTRSTIASACTANTDIVVLNHIAYPATFFSDNYIYTYNVACRKDRTTGQYCDPQILSWSNQRVITANQTCSDCWLGSLAAKLNNPLAYDKGLASQLASITSSCKATGYAVTSPTAYARNATATTQAPFQTVTTPPGCKGSYSIQTYDTCISVSQALNVSTYYLLYYNNLDLYCRNFATASQSLCIPPSCKTYTWQALDTCNSVVSGLSDVTLAQFSAWNPNFNYLCRNAAAFTGYQVCVGPPGGQLVQASGTGNGVTTAATTAAPVPTNAMTNSTRNCGAWYTIQKGDTCSLVSVANAISLSDFYVLNPEINTNCTNLLLGEAYCVEPVGNIQTYSGYKPKSTGSLITITPASFAPVNTAIPTPSSNPGFIYTSSLLPTAPGTISGCVAYQNFDNSSHPYNDCSVVATDYRVSADDLLSWNPSLSSNISTCDLQPGYSYCVKQSNITRPLPHDSNYCQPVNNASIVQSGTASNCDCYSIVHGYDKGVYLCGNIEFEYSITDGQLKTWNPWLNSDCDTNLYAKLTSFDARAICVGVNAGQPLSSTATASATKTSSEVSSTTSSTMGPTASGEIAGCQSFHTVQSGDSCDSIDTKYNITFTQFYQWNPSIGSNCQSLWLGYAYCVKGPSSTSPSAPTQSGIASNCNNYYTVANGDSCAKIETQFNDTFAQLYQWNPAIGSNCQSLWVGYAICVGVSS